MSADSAEGRLAADFSADPEEILPEAGTLESAKSYREKKAKPLLAKIVKVLRSLFRKYIDLKGKFDRLQGDYDRVREGNARLSDRLMEVKMENKKLRQISADYTRVKRRWRRRWRPTSRGNRRRRAASGPGAPLTGEGGK